MEEIYEYTPLKVEIPDLQKPDSDPRQLRAFSSHEFSNVFLVFGPDQGPNGPDFTLSTEVAITIVNPPSVTSTPTSTPTSTSTSTSLPANDLLCFPVFNNQVSSNYTYNFFAPGITQMVFGGQDDFRGIPEINSIVEYVTVTQPLVYQLKAFVYAPSWAPTAEAPRWNWMLTFATSPAILTQGWIDAFYHEPSEYSNRDISYVTLVPGVKYYCINDIIFDLTINHDYTGIDLRLIMYLSGVG